MSELSETLSFTVAGGVTSDGSVDKFTVPGTVEINDFHCKRSSVR